MEFRPGLKIGKLVLIRFLGRDKHSKKIWLCQCECGNTCNRAEGNLKSTAVPHCGCSPHWRGTNKRFVDLSGKKFGRLTVIEHKGKDKHSHNLWLCKCECGEYIVSDTSALNTGKVQSCGCKKKELLTKKNITHNHSDTRLYRIYAHMKDRCYNETLVDFQYYGGRGITVCQEWLCDFESFYNWALSNGYSEGLSIDRIDVNGNYEPSNCRWVTMKIQCNNKRNTLRYTFDGRTHTLMEWVELTGASYSAVYQRYRRGTLDNLISESLNKKA